MSARIAETSPKAYARVAGILYLLLLPMAIFGIMAAPTGLIVPGDISATAQNLTESGTLYRFSIVVALLVQVVNILVVLALYRLLKPVNKAMATLMVVFLLVAVPIAMFNELHRFALVLLLTNPAHLAAFTTEQVSTLVTLILDSHELGISIAGIFWGLWLFPMGYLVYKSGFLPRIIGLLLMIGCLGYLVDSAAAMLIPGNTINVAMFTFWGEIIFPLWLVIRGVNVEQWKKRALESA